MTEYRVKQLYPTHADHISYYNDKYLNKMFSEEVCVAQPKYDGERMLIHIDDGNIYCTSRRFSKKTGRYMENQDKLPILKDIFKDFPFKYTVLDCECYGKTWADAVGILHSLPDRAIELQKTTSIKFAVFDCLWFDGWDMRDYEYNERLSLAQNLVQTLENEQLHIVPMIDVDGYLYKPDEYDDRIHLIKSRDDCFKCMDAAIAKGFEGVVIKSLQRKYYDKGAYLKCKKFETVDVVVCGYQKGNGKYSDTIGALEVGYYDPQTNNVVKISKVNCGTDEDRNYWRDNWNSLVNTVIEVKCQEITDRSLRHPVYIRRREDKDYTTCTRDTIFKEE